MKDVVFIFVPIFGAIALVWVLSRVIVSSADEGRLAREMGSGRLEFAPNKRNFVALYLFLAFLLYLGGSLLLTSISTVTGQIGLAFWLLVALTLLAAFPGSVIASDEGLQQVYWLRRKKNITWKDVSKVAVDEKHNRVTITGKGRVKIVFMRQLPDRARLMAELEKYCGDKLPAGAKQNAALAAS